MPAIRSRGGRKRGFKAYSSPIQAGWDKPGGGGFPGDPFELTMKRVKLGSNFQPFGMDESRKQKMRRMIWYWQWSRDWNWRQIAAIANIQPDLQKAPSVTVEKDAEQHAATMMCWYWQWPKKTKKQKKNSDLKKLVGKRGNELLSWMVSLNPRQLNINTTVRH